MTRDRQPFILPQPAQSAAEARYVSYRTLLSTGRAVKKSGHSIIVSTAGEHPQRHKLTCASGADAKRLYTVFTAALLAAKTDHHYNQILRALFTDVRNQWHPINERVKDIHECEYERTKGPAKLINGVCSCGFDWKLHTSGEGCRCKPVRDDDGLQAYEFVVHQPIG